MGYANKPGQAVVGLETSKLQLKAALLRDGELLCKVLENDMAGYRWLRSWLQKNDVAVSGLRVCMRLDAPHSDSAARSLALMGMQVCDAPPAALEQFARSSGYGAQAGLSQGAALLARYAEAVRSPRWTPPSPAYMELRLWLQRLQQGRPGAGLERASGHGGRCVSRSALLVVVHVLPGDRCG